MRLASANRLRWAGLGAAVVFVTAAIVITVIWHQNVVPQKEAVTDIVKAGALCLYDFEYDFTPREGRIPGYRRPLTPSPLLQLAVGKDAIATPVYVQLTGRQVGDGDVARICDSLVRLPTVRHLNLRGTQVSDKGIECLNRLCQLAVLDIRQSAITPNGVRSLQGSLPACRILSGMEGNESSSENGTSLISRDLP